MTELICILGVDGSGKSTILRRLTENLNKTNKNILYVHLYPKNDNIKSAIVTEEHSPTLPAQYVKYNKFLSLLKFLWVSLVTYRFIVTQRMFKNYDYIFFDRYLYDFLISPERCAMSDLGISSRILTYLIPKCDKTIVLWGTGYDINKRKSELTVLQIDMIQNKQFKFFEKFDNVIFVNTSENTVAESIEKIEGFVSLR